eukprot:3145162-Alexandrium_andersonii.AAC.1
MRQCRRQFPGEWGSTRPQCRSQGIPGNGSAAPAGIFWDGNGGPGEQQSYVWPRSSAEPGRAPGG